MSDDKFVNGLIVKAPPDGAPDYVIAKLSFKIADMIAWLQAQQGDWANAEIKVSQGGKWYAAKDDWKPGQDGERRAPARREEPKAAPAPRQAPASDFADDDIPF